MSRTQLPRPADLALVSAALRHLRDAENLSRHPGQSLDQAFHLAGLGPECARKAAIATSWSNKPLGHDLGDTAEPVLKLVLALDPSVARYTVRDWETRYPSLSAWRPDCRYAETGTYKVDRVEPLLREAWDAVTELLAALWADGRLPLERVR